MSYKTFKPQDHYFHKAKKDWLVARSAYKLEEIDSRFSLFGRGVESVLDIWCAPGSWIQYAHTKLQKSKNFKIIWIDLKPVKIELDHVHTYVGDIEDMSLIDWIMADQNIKKFDIIMSDLAPNTIWFKDIDAIRCIEILEKTLPIYEKYLKPEGKFAIKIFMGPGFEQFIARCKNIRWWNKIKVFKPKACRDISKETYIIKL